MLGMLVSCGAPTQVDQSVRLPSVGALVNQPIDYPVTVYPSAINCVVDMQQPLGRVSKQLFGTNLEWFNEAGGLASSDVAHSQKLVSLAKQQGVSVMRFPGGILADYYHWKDGVGPISHRPKQQHPTDSGTSENRFGSPEFFRLLHATGAQGLITVNAGTASAQEAAEWVAYANQPHHPLRQADGFNAPIGIKLWEVGNELYYPGNPHEQKIGVTPEVYASRFIQFADAIKAVDPTVQTIAIGVAKSHIGPDTQYPDWTEILLKKAANKIDMIAVHNAYFPFMYTERQPSVEGVYPALMASPEAVDRSLSALEKLIERYEGKRHIGIAITEWGALFSLPQLDPYWVDHVKTMGSGVYVGRLMQVMMSHPRVELANYFKLTDRSFMGWINYQGEPKVPYWVFALYANYSGSERMHTALKSPTYQTPAVGIIMPEKEVEELTAISTYNAQQKKLYVNFVNRSMKTAYPVKLTLQQQAMPATMKILRVQAKEITAHNGRDLPPEWPHQATHEPYTTAAKNSIGISQDTIDAQRPFTIAPFSVATVVLDM